MRLSIQKENVNNVKTVADIMTLASKLRCAENEADSICKSVSKFREWATQHVIKNPSDAVFFPFLSPALKPNQDKVQKIIGGSYTGRSYSL